MNRSYDWDGFVDRLRRALSACERHGGETQQLIVEPPAHEKDICEIEAALETTLPSTFRHVVKSFSRKVQLYWQLPTNTRSPVREVFSGYLEWSLIDLVQIEENRQKTASEVFSNVSDPYDAVWHGKLAFHAVPNGDMHALDLRSRGEFVVYLSHEGSDSHGYELAADFLEYIDRLSRLGCPGSEDFQLMPFMSGSKSHLDPDCPNAKQWLDWFGM